MKSPSPKLFPFQSNEHQTKAGSLAYLDQGNGDETILCVHGNPTWSFYFRSIIDRFSDRYRVIVPDHIGCGRSAKPPRSEFDYSLASHRDNLVQLIRDLDLSNVTLVAHDWGGAIGLTTLLAERERFKRIVLLNTGAFPPPYVPIRIAACRTPLLGTLAVRGLNLFAKAAITMAVSRSSLSSEVSEGLLAPYDNWKNRVAIDAFVKDIPLTKSHPTYVTLKQLEADLPTLANFPSLLIWGMKDWCFREECLRRFQSAWPSAHACEIADAGHYVIEDAPGETLEAIASFLSQND